MSPSSSSSHSRVIADVCLPAPRPPLQHTFLTQQCLKQELTLDLLEKFRHPEKLKSCVVTDDEEMEVRLGFMKKVIVM